MFSEALLWEKKQNYNNAIKVYKKILIKNPDHFESWLNLGALFFREGKGQSAIQCYKKAILLKKDVRAVFNLGLIYYKLKKYDLAMKCFHHCIKLDVQFLQAYILTGYLYIDQNQLDEAIQIISRGLQIHKNNESLMVCHAVACFAGEKLQECLEILQKILDKNPDNKAALKLQARASIQNGVSRSSIENFRILIKDDPDLAQIEAILGKPENESVQENLLQKKKIIGQKNIKTKQDYMDLSLISFLSGNGNAALNYLLYAVKDP